MTTDPGTNLTIDHSIGQLHLDQYQIRVQVNWLGVTQAFLTCRTSFVRETADDVWQSTEATCKAAIPELIRNEVRASVPELVEFVETR